MRSLNCRLVGKTSTDSQKVRVIAAANADRQRAQRGELDRQRDTPLDPGTSTAAIGRSRGGTTCGVRECKSAEGNSRSRRSSTDGARTPRGACTIDLYFVDPSVARKDTKLRSSGSF